MCMGAMMDFSSALCTGGSRNWEADFEDQVISRKPPGWNELFRPTFATIAEGRGERGEEISDLSRSECFIYFFTVFSIFPKAITCYETALQIEGKSEEGKKQGLTDVSNPPLNSNGFIRKYTLFCMKTCFFCCLISAIFPPFSSAVWPE